MKLLFALIVMTACGLRLKQTTDTLVGGNLPVSTTDGYQFTSTAAYNWYNEEHLMADLTATMDIIL